MNEAIENLRNSPHALIAFAFFVAAISAQALAVAERKAD
jgi:hypothetical protein